MSDFTLISDFSLDTTSLSNIYIDEYMSANNESQIKIYLYLLRNLSKGASVSVITIADTFNYSVTDVERALLYMEKQGLMGLKIENGNIVGLRLLPLKKRRTEGFRDTLQIENFRLMETPEASENTKTEASLEEIEKPEYTSAQVAKFTKISGVEELLFVIQQYIGKPLAPADLKSILFMNECLEFEFDLIEYLVEYCADNGKKNFRYIEKVARDWHKCGITSVEEAKENISDVPKEVYEVFKAFNIKAGSRKPSLKEKGFVKRWVNDYAFGMDVIKRACEMTLDKTHSVSFEYADAILTDWHKKGVKHAADIETLLNAKRTEQTSANVNTRKQAKTPSNSFNNFAGREYDFSQLEKEIWSN